ncbi:NAD-dependent epimerase/dehydratase family protein [Lentzea sp. NPDC092896]|uniref:NAD-dependent epimerase/dehydratase family protein n=1 Tax=Lentzea sp. NPDC092896 TaxID=3364127 RepID=UPI00382387CB
MKVLVTGGAGVLGINLVRRLAESGHEVTSLDVVPGAGAHRDVVGDIRDAGLVRDLTRGAEAVVHCAAALPSHSAEEIRSVDVGGTRTVLEAARRNGVERFVHLSSTAVYGLPERRPTPENHSLDAVDPYNRAKIAAEAICAEFRADGMCVPVLRPKTFLGPQRLGIFAMLFEWAQEGRSFPVLGSGDVRCQMLDVDDLCDAVLAAMTGPAAQVGDTFNVAATRFTTLREEFQSVLDAAGHGGRVVSVPVRPALGALRVLEVLRLSPVYQRLAHKLTEDSFVCTEKAERVLGFAPKYSNVDSLLRTYEWYREHVWTRKVHSGRSHRDPWRQGALRLAKALF